MEHLLLLSCIESRVENHRSFYGRFQLGPFQVGQGITVANTLRRALLSELTGLAITSVKINGASHEYSTLKGVRESVLHILLNLKQIVLTSDFQFNESQIGYLHVQGPAIVKANDLKLPLGIQCVDPEQYIATLSYDGILKLKFVISTGQNYIIQTPLEVNEKVFNQKIGLVEDSAWMSISESNRALSSEMLAPEKKTFLNTNIPTKKITNKLPSKILIYEQKIHTKIPTYKHILESKVQDSTKILVQQKNDKNSKSFMDSQFLLNSDNLVTKNFSDKQRKKNQTESFFSKPKISFQLKKPEFLFLKNEKNTNILPIDAVFMPVNKVNFMVETDTEAEKTTERVILEIWTNGSVHPRQAIHEAAKSIIRLFFPFQETRLLKSIGLTSTKIVQKSSPELQEKLNFSLKKENIALEKKRYSIDIGNLDFSLRPYTCLKRANINTVGDLLQYSADELLLLKNFGKRSLEEVEKNLAQMGLSLNIKTSEEFQFFSKKRESRK
jgi:DNA-directed RNA polymerase alpha subunit